MNPNVSSFRKPINRADNPIRFKVLVVDQPGPHLDLVVRSCERSVTTSTLPRILEPHIAS